MLWTSLDGVHSISETQFTTLQRNENQITMEWIAGTTREENLEENALDDTGLDNAEGHLRQPCAQRTHEGSELPSLQEPEPQWLCLCTRPISTANAHLHGRELNREVNGQQQTSPTAQRLLERND